MKTFTVKIQDGEKEKICHYSAPSENSLRQRLSQQGRIVLSVKSERTSYSFFTEQAILSTAELALFSAVVTVGSIGNSLCRRMAIIVR